MAQQYRIHLECRRFRLLPWARRSLGGGNYNHSSILAWRIPGTEEPGGLQSKGWQRIRHNAAATRGCRAPRSQCGLSICGPDSGRAGEVRGVGKDRSSSGGSEELRAQEPSE